MTCSYIKLARMRYGSNVWQWKTQVARFTILLLCRVVAHPQQQQQHNNTFAAKPSTIDFCAHPEGNKKWIWWILSLGFDIVRSFIQQTQQFVMYGMTNTATCHQIYKKATYHLTAYKKVYIDLKLHCIVRSPTRPKQK